jgi:preprotein translocase subunit SecD
MRNHLKLCVAAGLVLLTGCPSRRPANLKHVSLGIFEVIDCKTSGMSAMSLKGSTEKYCLAATPVVDETDIRMAEPSRGESGRPRLSLFFSVKTGQRMKETTERMSAEHLRSSDPARMGLVIDGTLVSVAVVNGVISDSLVIDGAFNREEAVQIAESLNANPPPRPSPSPGQK